MKPGKRKRVSKKPKLYWSNILGLILLMLAATFNLLSGAINVYAKNRYKNEMSYIQGAWNDYKIRKHVFCIGQLDIRDYLDEQIRMHLKEI